ncbi:MAG TPA: hypothetical protein VFH68_03660 [Polyangia bacterium]|jgi:hypothetical protein|nr:hypothetical protein [Polyangia bacterium]
MAPASRKPERKPEDEILPDGVARDLDLEISVRKARGAKREL